MRKIIPLFFLVFLIGLLFPLVILAADLVPCGGEGEPVCQFCHFFVMIDNVFDFVLLKIIPPVAVLMLVIGGIMFYFAGGKPELVTQGKDLIKAVVIGLFLAYGAYMIVGFVLMMVGAADFPGLQQLYDKGIIEIECP